MRPLLAVVVCLCLLALSGAAHAADRTVGATVENTFTLRVTAVAPGEAVTFANRGGLHDVDWEDPFPTQPARLSEGWTVQRRFARPGVYRYFCSAHGTRGGIGMAGVVYVTARGAVPAPRLVSASVTPAAGALAVRVNASEYGRLEVTVYRGAAVVRRHSGRALGGANPPRRVAGLATGRHRVVLRLVSGARRSAPRTLSAVVR